MATSMPLTRVAAVYLFASIFGMLVIGILLGQFAAGPVVLGICTLVLVYLIRGGTDALVLGNVVITVLFLLTVRGRQWPVDWVSSAPAEHPQLWASLLFGMWLACVLVSIALAQASQSLRVAGRSFGQRALLILTPTSAAAALGYWLGL